MDLSKIILIVLCILLFVYDAVGFYFLIKDYEVVHGCKATDEDVHAIWETNLWSYCLVSVLLGTFVAVLLIRTPFGKTVEAMQLHLAKMRGKKMADSRIDELEGLKEMEVTPRVKFGLLPNLPDWLFLCAGSAAFCTATVLGILAFWGYVELFMTRPVCSDRRVAFEELQLWQFGHVTFVGQVVVGITLSILGMAYWITPFLLELTFPEPRPVVPRQPSMPYGAAAPTPYPGSSRTPTRP